MARLPPTASTKRRLMLLSGNRCAICKSHLLGESSDYVGKFAHIESAEPGGRRYNTESSDEERRLAANLILVCANDHEIIDGDDWEKYSTERLRQIKFEHESTVRGFLDDQGLATADYELADLVIGRLLPVIQICSAGFSHLSRWQAEAIDRLAELALAGLMFEDPEAQAAWEPMAVATLNLRDVSAVEFFSVDRAEHFVLQYKAVDSVDRRKAPGETDEQHKDRMSYINRSIQRWGDACESTLKCIQPFFRSMKTLDIAQENLQLAYADALAGRIIFAAPPVQERTIY